MFALYCLMKYPEFVKYWRIVHADDEHEEQFLWTIILLLRVAFTESSRQTCLFPLAAEGHTKQLSRMPKL